MRDIHYQDDYRSGYDHIVEDFFRPSLRGARLYWRAVGYFSSSSLESFGSPLGEFIKNGGRIRLVTSVELSAADLTAIENGAPKQDICAQRLEQIIENDFADGVGDGTARLARLLEMGRLEIQIAVPKTGTGIYHEKIGLFFDGEDFVAFTGSRGPGDRPNAQIEDEGRVVWCHPTSDPTWTSSPQGCKRCGEADAAYSAAAASASIMRR